MKKELKEKIALYIEAKATEQGINPALVLAIAKSESEFDPLAKNPQSSASGTMQFINGTFSYYCIGGYDKSGKSHGYFLTDTMDDKNDPIIQTDCAIEMLKEKNGWKHWETSSWDKSLSLR